MQLDRNKKITADVEDKILIITRAMTQSLQQNCSESAESPTQTSKQTKLEMLTLETPACTSVRMNPNLSAGRMMKTSTQAARPLVPEYMKLKLSFTRPSQNVCEAGLSCRRRVSL